MAKDYFKYNTLSDFEVRVREANIERYPTGRTGYEQYYTDIQVCWRQLFNPELRNKILALTEETDTLKSQIEKLNKQIKNYENEIIRLNNSLNTATTQSSKDSITTNLLAAQDSHTKAKYQKSQKEYLLEQKQESLDKYSDDITNYY
jgi:chromosome segregation ATPase